MLIRQRDRDAFAYLYDRYAAALNGIICRMIEDKIQAEDILQETFIKIWFSFASYDPARGRLFTWMSGITRNMVIDLVRSRGYKQAQVTGQEPLENGSVKINTDAIGLREQLQKLTHEQRQVIELAYFTGLKQEEISSVIGIPLGTVKTRLRAAVNVLRKIYQIK